MQCSRVTLSSVRPDVGQGNRDQNAMFSPCLVGYLPCTLCILHVLQPLKHNYFLTLLVRVSHSNIRECDFTMLTNLFQCLSSSGTSFLDIGLTTCHCCFQRLILDGKQAIQIRQYL